MSLSENPEYSSITHKPDASLQGKGVLSGRADWVAFGVLLIDPHPYCLMFCTIAILPCLAACHRLDGIRRITTEDSVVSSGRTANGYDCYCPS